jgi:hypothetical protein
MKPVMRPGVRNLALRDYRNPGDDNHRAITFQQAAAQTAAP